MALSCRLHLSLHGTLVVVATEMMAMAITVVATATQEVALPRQGNVMLLCNAKKVKVSTANNAGASATAEQLACTWAALWGK